MASLDEFIRGCNSELDGYLVQMSKFSSGQESLQDILRKLSGFSARASMLRLRVSQSKSSEARQLKSDVIDPFLKETDFQFRLWSRLGSVNKDEWEMTTK